MNDLSARLKSLKEKSRGIKSERTNTSTLTTFLYIIKLAEYDSYINYMAGAKALYNFLTEEHIGLDLQVEKFPLINVTSFKPPWFFQSYESNELAKILAGPIEKYSNIDSYLLTLSKMQRAIYLTVIAMEKD